jgi:4-amino-4-deoxy-L-arabinose transferase-like glycosyltransferase
VERDAFTALVLLATLAWLRYREDPSTKRFAWLALASALAFAQRYVGVLFVASVVLSWLASSDGTPLRERAKRAALFAAASAVPIVLWFVRNRMVSSTFDGRRGLPSNDWIGDASDALLELWPFLPRAWSVVALLALVPLACTLLGVRYLLQEERRRSGADLVALFPLVFALGLMILRHAVELDAIDQRLMSPALPFVALTAVVGTVEALRRPTSNAIRASVALAVALWIGWASVGAARSAAASRARAREQGLGVYDSPAWRASPAIAWLRDHSVEGELYSNEPFAVFVLADLRCASLPAAAVGLRQARAPLERSTRAADRAVVPLPATRALSERRARRALARRARAGLRRRRSVARHSNGLGGVDGAPE